jgi:hypothetical protein
MVRTLLTPAGNAHTKETDMKTKTKVKAGCGSQCMLCSQGITH